MSTIKIRIDSSNAQHIWLTLFAGPDRDHLAKTGQVVMKHDEVDAFTTTLFAGAAVTGVDFQIESLDGEPVR